MALLAHICVRGQIYTNLYAYICICSDAPPSSLFVVVPSNSPDTMGDVSGFVSGFIQDPNAAMEQVTDTVASMGVLGPLYFGIMYTIAEVFAIPAIPLTASAGYLFGVVPGRSSF